MGAETGESGSLLEPFIVFGLWAIVAVLHMSQLGGRGNKRNGCVDQSTGQDQGTT